MPLMACSTVNRRKRPSRSDWAKIGLCSRRSSSSRIACSETAMSFRFVHSARLSRLPKYPAR